MSSDIEISGREQQPSYFWSWPQADNIVVVSGALGKHWHGYFWPISFSL